MYDITGDKMKKNKIKKTTAKRKQERDYISIDGMKIDGDILLHVDKPMRDNLLPLQMLISIVASFSTVFLGLSYFDTGANYGLVSISIVIMCLSFAIIKSEETFLRIIGLVIIGMHLLTFAFFYKRIANGFIVVYSNYLIKANKPNSVISGLVSEIPPSEQETVTNLFILLVTLLICFGMVFSCLYKINLPAMVLYSFPVFEIGAYWGWKPSTICFLTLLICWTTVFALQLVNYSANKAGIRNTFAIHPRKKTFYFTSDKLKRGFFTKYIYSMFIVCLCIILLLYFAVTAIGKDRPDKLLDARRDLSRYIEDMSYRSLTNTLSDLNDSLLGNNNIGGTNGGRLGRVDKISYNGSTARELVIEDFNYPMYLKGYIAGDYKDNSWEETDPGNRLDGFTDGIDDYIQDIGFNKITKLTQYESIEYLPSEFSVKIKGASKKYAYSPYFTSYASDSSKGDDRCKPSTEGSVSLRSRRYLMNYYNISKAPIVNDEISYDLNSGLLLLASNARYSMSATETTSEYDYYEYVIDTYLDVTGSDGLKEAINDIDSKYIGSNGYSAQYEYGLADYSSYIKIVNGINKYFEDNYEYTLSPGKTPSDRDFIDYFISEQKKGYCSYFATAGVMLLRHYGIPARYVEGYIIHPNQLNGHNSNGMNEIDVLDKCAHAWAEIYTRELGWIPIEFTPGYEEDNPNIDEDDIKPKETQTTTTTATTTMTTTTKSTDSSNATTSNTNSSSQESKKTTTTTKKVSASKVDDSDDGSSEGKGGGIISSPFGSGDGGGGSIGIIALYLVIIFVIIMIIIARRAYNLKKLASSVENKNINKAVRSCYNASLRYLGLMGIKENDNQSDYKDLQKIIEKMKRSGYSEESSKSFEFLSENAILAYFGREAADEAILSRCRLALSAIKKETSKLLNPIEKLGAIIVANLY